MYTYEYIRIKKRFQRWDVEQLLLYTLNICIRIYVCICIYINVLVWLYTSIKYIYTYIQDQKKISALRCKTAPPVRTESAYPDDIRRKVSSAQNKNIVLSQVRYIHIYRNMHVNTRDINVYTCDIYAYIYIYIILSWWYTSKSVFSSEQRYCPFSG
jgi:hypothetical protein